MSPSPVLQGEWTPKSQGGSVMGTGGRVPIWAGRRRDGGGSSFQKPLRAKLGGGSDYEPRTGSVETGEINCGASLPNVLL